MGGKGREGKEREGRRGKGERGGGRQDKYRSHDDGGYTLLRPWRVIFELCRGKIKTRSEIYASTYLRLLEKDYIPSNRTYMSQSQSNPSAITEYVKKYMYENIQEEREKKRKSLFTSFAFFIFS